MTIASQIVSVLLVEDDSNFRRGLHTLLSFYSDDCYLQFKIVGEATSCDQAIKLAIEQKPALILLDVKLDLKLPEDSGLKVLMDLKKLDYHGKVLILSAHREDELVFRAMQLNQMFAPGPRRTSPMSTAVGATQAVGWMVGATPLSA